MVASRLGLGKEGRESGPGLGQVADSTGDTTRQYINMQTPGTHIYMYRIHSYWKRLANKQIDVKLNVQGYKIRKKVKI